MNPSTLQQSIGLKRTQAYSSPNKKVYEEKEYTHESIDNIDNNTNTFNHNDHTTKEQEHDKLQTEKEWFEDDETHLHKDSSKSTSTFTSKLSQAMEQIVNLFSCSSDHSIFQEVLSCTDHLQDYWEQQENDHRSSSKRQSKRYKEKRYKNDKLEDEGDDSETLDTEPSSTSRSQPDLGMHRTPKQHNRRHHHHHRHHPTRHARRQSRYPKRDKDKDKEQVLSPCSDSMTEMEPQRINSEIVVSGDDNVSALSGGTLEQMSLTDRHCLVMDRIENESRLKSRVRSAPEARTAGGHGTGSSGIGGDEFGVRAHSSSARVGHCFQDNQKQAQASTSFHLHPSFQSEGQAQPTPSMNDPADHPYCSPSVQKSFSLDQSTILSKSSDTTEFESIWHRGMKGANENRNGNMKANMDVISVPDTTVCSPDTTGTTTLTTITASTMKSNVTMFTTVTPKKEPMRNAANDPNELMNSPVNWDMTSRSQKLRSRSLRSSSQSSSRDGGKGAYTVNTIGEMDGLLSDEEEI